MKIGNHSVKAIDGEAVADVWEEILPLVHKLDDWTRGEFTVEDIRRFVRDKAMLLWLFSEDDEIILVGVTEVVQYPRKKICNIYALAGRKMQEMWELFAPYFLNWLQVNEIEGLQTTCRDTVAEKTRLLGFTKLVNVMEFDVASYERSKKWN